MESGEFGQAERKENNLSGKINIELGYHKLGVQTTRLDHGDLTLDVWNSEVRKRMREYNPAVVAVDSIDTVPEEKINMMNSEYPSNDRKFAWMWAPGEASRINEKGEYILVAGDIGYSDASMLIKDGISDETGRNSLQELGNMQAKKERESFLARMAEQGTSLLIAGILTKRVLDEFTLKEQEKVVIGDPNAKKHLSRRKFLKLAGMTAAVTASTIVIGRGLAGTLTPLAPNEKLHDIGETIMSLTEKVWFSQETWLNGRTALLIEKCNTAMNQGLTSPDAKGAVVMGNAHGFESKTLLENAVARKKAIHDYASQIVVFYDKVLDLYPEINKKDAISRLLDWVATGNMLVVTEPESDQVSKDQVFGTLKKHMQYVGSFKSPAVLDAIRDLRKPVQKSDEKVQKPSS